MTEPDPALPAGLGVEDPWLLNDLLTRIPYAGHALLLSADGIPVATSDSLSDPDAVHLAASCAGMLSLAASVSERHGHEEVRQIVVELQGGYLQMCPAGAGAYLMIFTSAEADPGATAYEMAALVAGAAGHLRVPSRSAPSTGQDVVGD
jgi:predicted regulator of Ras-like GTPase activity (Roadblock/LC7/MglB family)